MSGSKYQHSKNSPKMQEIPTFVMRVLSRVRRCRPIKFRKKGVPERKEYQKKADETVRKEGEWEKQR